jgi:hypothetical protein
MAGMSDKKVIDWILSCREEADEAKTDRMSRNKDNFDMFHLKHDFSHKEQGQSTEILSKQSMAVETIKSFFQQALADIGDWWKAECRYAVDERSLPVRAEEITKLTNYLLEKAQYFSHVGNSIQSALLGSLAITKVYGCAKAKPKYVSKKKGRGKSMKRWVDMIEDKTWELKFEIVRAENYFPDPSGRGLYEIEEMFPDYIDVLRMSEGDEAIYDRAAVLALSKGTSDSEDDFDKSRETGQNTSTSGHRPKVKLTEFWGDILNPDTGEMEYENCVCTIANDTVMIRKPTPNPLWHQRRPYVASPLYEVPNSVWHRAPMDAPTQHNRALIELYNLMVDAAMKQVHAVSQLRKDALDNSAQVSEGIKPGMTLMVNSMLPVGGKVMEPLTAVTVPTEAFNILNLMNQEFNASALTNDLRQGVMPFRAVKATEVVEASQTITSVFQGLAKNYEAKQSMRELELAWMTVAQNWDKISKEEFVALFGGERGEELHQMSPQDIFVNTVNGVKFRVFGVSLTLSKAQDFRKLTTLLQTVSSSPMLMEKYLEKYDLAKTLGEIMTALNIDKSKLEIPVAMQQTMQEPQEGAPEQGPDMMSQTPQAGAGSMADLFGGAEMPQSEFPGSPATAGGVA